MGIFAAIIGLFGNVFTGVSKLRTEQAEVIKTSVGSITEMIKQADLTDAEKVKAHALMMAADSKSESFLTRTWRPMIIYACSGTVFAYLFGWTPVNMTPEILNRFLDLMITVVLGFGGFRTGEKIVDNILRQVNIGKIVQSFTNKIV